RRRHPRRGAPPCPWPEPAPDAAMTVPTPPHARWAGSCRATSFALLRAARILIQSYDEAPLPARGEPMRDHTAHDGERSHGRPRCLGTAASAGSVFLPPPPASAQQPPPPPPPQPPPGFEATGQPPPPPPPGYGQPGYGQPPPPVYYGTPTGAPIM